MKIINQIKRWRGIFLFVFQKEFSVNKQYSLFRKAPARKGITLKCWLCSLCFMLPSLSAIAQNDSTNLKGIQGNRFYIGYNFNYSTEYNVPTGIMLGYLPFRNFLIGLGSEGANVGYPNMYFNRYIFSRYYFSLEKNISLFPEISYHHSFSKYNDPAHAYRGGIGISYQVSKNLGLEGYLAAQQVERLDIIKKLQIEKEIFFRLTAAFYFKFKKKDTKPIYDKSFPQLQQGASTLGGNFAFAYSKSNNPDFSFKPDKTILSSSLNAGYFVFPRIMLGITGSYSRYSNEAIDLYEGREWSAGIMARYYLPYKKVAFIGQLNGEKVTQYGSSTAAIPTYYYNFPFYRYGGGIGIAWFAKPYISFEYILLCEQKHSESGKKSLEFPGSVGISFYLYRNENNQSN